MSDSLQKAIDLNKARTEDESLLKKQRLSMESSLDIEQKFLPTLVENFDAFLINPEKSIEDRFDVLGNKGYKIRLDLSEGSYQYTCFKILSELCGFDESSSHIYNDEEAIDILKKEAYDILKSSYPKSFVEYDWEIEEIVCTENDSGEIGSNCRYIFSIVLRSHKTLRCEYNQHLASLKAKWKFESDERVKLAHKKAQEDQMIKSKKWSVILTVFFLVLVPAAAILLSIESGHLTPEQVLPAEWVEPVKSFFNWK